jgi:thiosulfate dehydrogenase [quinone] large subunit
MKKPKLFIALLRMALGWIFLYQGIVAITNPSWSLVPFIDHARTFPGFYASIMQEPMLGYVSYIVKGIFMIVGALLIVGAWARLAAFLGIILMLFFYFPVLHFPHVGDSYYIIDEHMIYILILLYLFMVRGSEFFGLGSMFKPSRY